SFGNSWEGFCMPRPFSGDHPMGSVRSDGSVGSDGSGPQHGPANAAGRFLEELPGQRLEFLGKVGEVEFQGAIALFGLEQVEAGEFLFQVLGAGGGGVDEADVSGKDLLENGDEQRVVGAR